MEIVEKCSIMYGQGGILMNIIVNLLVIEDDTGTCEMYREYSEEHDDVYLVGIRLIPPKRWSLRRNTGQTRSCWIWSCRRVRAAE